MSPAVGRPMPVALPRRRLRHPGHITKQSPPRRAATQPDPGPSEAAPGPGGSGGGGPGAAL